MSNICHDNLIFMSNEVKTMQKRGTMLIVDDVEINRAILAHFFQDEFQLEEASNGREALDIIQRSQIDIVLLDLQMPVMNGYEATKAIRNLPSTYASAIPIVAMTANAFEQDREKAMAVGMDDYIAKPIDVRLLRETLSKLL